MAWPVDRITGCLVRPNVKIHVFQGIVHLETLPKPGVLIFSAHSHKFKSDIGPASLDYSNGHFLL